MDIKKIKLILMDMPWIHDSSNINIVSNYLVGNLISALNEFAPIEKRIIKENSVENYGESR